MERGRLIIQRMGEIGELSAFEGDGTVDIGECKYMLRKDCEGTDLAGIGSSLIQNTITPACRNLKRGGG
jgi:hypothetical protein